MSVSGSKPPATFRPSTTKVGESTLPHFRGKRLAILAAIAAAALAAACSPSSPTTTSTSLAPAISVTAPAPATASHTASAIPVATTHPTAKASKSITLPAGPLGMATSANYDFGQVGPDVAQLAPEVPLRTDADNFRSNSSTFATDVADAARHGHPILAIADDYAPANLAANPQGDCQGQYLCGPSASAAGHYAAFALQVATICVASHHCLALELGNEPNKADRWQPQADPIVYAIMVATTCPLIHQHYKDLPVILGGLAPSDTGNGSYQPAAFLGVVFDWLRLNAPAAVRCFNAVATHPYDGLAQTQAVYSLMKLYGYGDRKIWATEVGVAAGQGPAAFQQLVQGWFGQPYAGPLFYYSWLNTGTGWQWLMSDHGQATDVGNAFHEAAARNDH